MWSNDYPHNMSTWPNSRTLLPAKLAGLDAEQVDAVLRGNATSLYEIGSTIAR